MRGTANWTCFRVDAEQSFAPKHVATLPEPGIETANKAAVCLVGQVRSASVSQNDISER
jgi:hypothetical protein